MRFLKVVILFLFVFTVSSFSLEHKYYISNTQIEYAKDKASVQIISRLFIDDFEDVLKERYDESLTFDDTQSNIDFYVDKYLSEKLRIKIDNSEKSMNYIGKEIEAGIVKCYLEIQDVSQIETIEVSNETLFDLYATQQNITKLNINSDRKSFILTKQNAKAVLNFN